MNTLKTDVTETPAREPDRTVHSAWEPQYGHERRRMVATQATIFRVDEYTEVVDRPIKGYHRYVTLFWDNPAHYVPVVSPITFETSAHFGKVDTSLTIGKKFIPAETIGYRYCEWANTRFEIIMDDKDRECLLSPTSSE